MGENQRTSFIGIDVRAEQICPSAGDKLPAPGAIVPSACLRTLGRKKRLVNDISDTPVLTR